MTSYTTARSKQPYPRNLPSDELICLPFLDTDTSADLPVADAELSARGYPVWLIRLLRRSALPLIAALAFLIVALLGMRRRRKRFPV